MSDKPVIRPGMPTDTAFIYASWLHGVYFGNDWFRMIPKKIYYEKYHQFLDRLLQRPNIVVKCACIEEDPDVILGYSVSEPGVLHWIFVKKRGWRKMGIAKSLLPPDIHTVTHLTKLGKSLMKKEWIFNPFI